MNLKECNLKIRHIFLDHDGVISDDTRASELWEHTIASILKGRYGGDEETWRKANLIARERSVQYWTDFDWSGKDYNAEVDKANIIWMKNMLEVAGVDMSDEEVLDLSNRLRYEVPSKFSTAFPEVEGCLRRLTRMGMWLYVSSGGHSGRIEGSLVGAGLEGFFREVFGADKINTPKTSPEFYNKIFKFVEAAPSESVVVDDNPKALGWAKEAGAHAAVLVARAGKDDLDLPAGHCADAVIVNLSTLPEILAGC